MSRQVLSVLLGLFDMGNIRKHGHIEHLFMALWLNAIKRQPLGKKSAIFAPVPDFALPIAVMLNHVP